MKQINLYETIFKRKSMRRYDLTPLNKNTLAEISAYMRTLKPIDDNITTEMKILSQKDVKNLPTLKAPHYIAVFSENKEGYLTNAGFMLQQMDLFFSANDIGSCWIGMTKPTEKTLSTSKLEFVILLAFGKPIEIESLYRESTSEFNRKSLEQISNITNANELLEPAGLAPSSGNNQPWFFTGGDGIIHAYCVKSITIMYKRMHMIDMGIAMCHLWIAAKHFGKKVEFINDIAAQNNPPEGYYYIVSLNVK
ncbi:nitroreductase family protein [Clostridium formicaceticum]|uniref:Nitroreductase family protein n=1 Tax=Clostridium formicaceticum TaxID=1497 RepID=A0AAC9WFN2_9CLOT|nr:nitroreductase family protein [Clostridium formicaceticum]AOY76529.1 hypothetical protein BJL90_12060 [Clostridium formicaceticum]ARE86941.1 Nitroreductase family protein [Clostridium formicaceticum]